MATLGIDIGCISVKIAVVGTPEDRDSFEAIRNGSDLFYTPLGLPRFANPSFLLLSSDHSQKGFLDLSLTSCPINEADIFAFVSFVNTRPLPLIFAAQLRHRELVGFPFTF